MQLEPHYDDVVAEVADELAEFAAAAERIGVPRDRIILDPGIGFGKRVEDNLRILSSLERLRRLGYPLLIGLSRKAFLGSVGAAEFGEDPRILGTPYSGEEPSPRPAEGRLAAGLAANLHAAAAGAAVLRVHDVLETVDALKVAAAIRTAARNR